MRLRSIVIGVSTVLATVFLAVPAAQAAPPAWSGPTTLVTGGASVRLADVSCAAVGHCVATDSGGSIHVLNAGAWSAPIASGFDTLGTISCPTRSFCAAPVGRGVATFNGHVWKAPRTVVHGSLDVHGLACVSATFCVASDQRDAFTFNGKTWSQGIQLASGTTNLLDVSCATTTFCVITDSKSDVYTWNGSTWSAPVPLQTVYLTTVVSCPAAGYCIAMDSEFHAFTLSAGVWSAPVLIGNVGDPVVENGSLACASITVCLALKGTTPYIHKGKSWTAMPSLPATGFVSLSCASARFCEAVDSGTGGAFQFS